MPELNLKKPTENYLPKIKTMTKIKTIEEAFKAKGLDPNALPDVSALPEGLRDYVIAQYQLAVVVSALNEGWEPDWSNEDQWKYYPWFSVEENDNKPSGFGLSCDVYVCWYSRTFVGSRLCFANRETAKYAAETFTELYERCYLISK